MDGFYQQISKKTEDISSNDEKENVRVDAILKQQNTRPHQREKLAESMRSVTLDKMSKQEVISHWNGLTEQLNEMGPPIRSRAEWRRVWSVHKFNKKRKLEAESQNLRSQVNQISADENANTQPTTPFAVQNDQSSNAVTHSASDPILLKLNEIVDQQKQIIKLLTTIIAERSS